MSGVPIDSAALPRMALLGVGATVVLDLWNLFLKRGFQIPSLSYALLGRWLLHMSTGTFSHANIGASAERRFEAPVGWVAHYSIGVGFGVGFIGIAPSGWLFQPTLLPALLFGLATVVFPFFLMQPAFGLGVAASKAPHPGLARLKSLATHAMFGVGLWATALGLDLAWQHR